jgi:hypothetical protein
VPTATKAIQILVEQGTVRETTGRARNRIFAYQRYIDILNRG